MGLIILHEDAVLFTIIVKMTKNIFDDNCSKNNNKRESHKIKKNKKLRQYEVQKVACVSL